MFPSRLRTMPNLPSNIGQGWWHVGDVQDASYKKAALRPARPVWLTSVIFHPSSGRSTLALANHTGWRMLVIELPSITELLLPRQCMVRSK